MKIIPKFFFEGQFCRAVAELPLEAQAKLAKEISTYEKKNLLNIIRPAQHLITMTCILRQFHRNYTPQDEEAIKAPTKLLRIVYYASFFGGQQGILEDRMDSRKRIEDLKEVVLLWLNQAAGQSPFNLFIYRTLGRHSLGLNSLAK